MSRRLLSTAVQIKAAPKETERMAAILGGSALTAYQPTDSEVRDAIGRVTRDLEEMRLARTDGSWTATEEFGFNINVTHEGEVVLRGSLVIERAND